ncbi:hypothetical protein BDY19DRAFT_905928 [Irpex rosettiformis]|uniref:Uncharacterized protein n=1 Tax=Irpex rosettiformis TaxID=378272 RepID=A0ACB8U5U7_9APHY|nr:hypothetical protein BDY19DRAFT_905928 [Irpex rosettiformis]
MVGRLRILAWVAWARMLLLMSTPEWSREMRYYNITPETQINATKLRRECRDKSRRCLPISNPPMFTLTNELSQPTSNAWNEGNSALLQETVKVQRKPTSTLSVIFPTNTAVIRKIKRFLRVARYHWTLLKPAQHN